MGDAFAPPTRPRLDKFDRSQSTTLAGRPSRDTLSGWLDLIIRRRPPREQHACINRARRIHREVRDDRAGDRPERPIDAGRVHGHKGCLRNGSSEKDSTRGPRRIAAISGETPSESWYNGTGIPLSIDRAGSSPSSEGLRHGVELKSDHSVG
jgi:hypothetical protein